MQLTKDLVAASATPLVLGILSEGDSYGYAILKRINELSGGELDWTDGMLYPLLHRLDRSGLVEADWRHPDGGRRRKYYRLTDDGVAALAEQQSQWSLITETLSRVWQEMPGAGDGERRRSGGLAGPAGTLGLEGA